MSAAAGEAHGEEVLELASCECCGLMEECTVAYTAHVRGRYAGRWICGLCAEALKDEIGLLGTEEALRRHSSFCGKSRSTENPAEQLMSAVRQLFRRSLDSPVGLRRVGSGDRWPGPGIGALRRQVGRS